MKFKRISVPRNDPNLGSYVMLIAGFGVPGSGKSSIMGRAAQILNAQCFLEPEESVWPDAVADRQRCGSVTALHYFRSVRVPQLYKARSEADLGRLVMVDSIYDKLCHLFIRNEAFNWLLAPTDLYYENFLELCRLDYLMLPNPDVLVLFDVELEDWRSMLQARGRSLDLATDIANNIHMQSIMARSVEKYMLEMTGEVRLVVFKNQYRSLEESSHQLAESLAGMLK